MLVSGQNKIKIQIALFGFVDTNAITSLFNDFYHGQFSSKMCLKVVHFFRAVFLCFFLSGRNSTIQLNSLPNSLFFNYFGCFRSRVEIVNNTSSWC